MEQKNEQKAPLRIKNLAELKRCIRPGTELVATSHSKHPALVGLVRVVTEVQTNAYYSVVKDQPTHQYSTCNYGKGFRSDFEKASNYLFEGTTIKVLDRRKLGAAVSMAKPECASQIRRLAENLDLFEFAPGAHTPEEYGKYMIQRSGHFEYDPNLDEFYDYERYGLQHMGYQSGVFTDRGYIAYVGTVSLEELMADDPAESYQREQDFQMGGMT